MESSVFNADIDAMEEISEKYKVKNVLFYKWDVIKFDALISKLEKFHILCKNYSNKEDLKEQVLEYSKDHEVVYVNTAMELLINTVNEVREYIWQPLSDNPDIFRDKYLQRELIQDHNPDLWVKFIKGTPETLDIKTIEEKVGYPCIVKPVDWVQSSWVAKISNKKDFEQYINNDYKIFHDRLKARWVDNKELIVEEFINWKLYSIDYFVTSKWNVHLAKPVKVRLWIDVDIKDYCNIARISTEKTEWEFKWKRLKTFINSTVKATGIRNTYVHHEFKINSKWEMKTIELNWRIGWWRMELYKKAYDFNLYELLLGKNTNPGKLKENNIAVNLYASKQGILKGLNKKLFSKITERESVYDISFEECMVGKEIGLTKDGFVKAWAIKLKHKDYCELRKDFLYIRWKYNELLDIEVDKKKKKKKKHPDNSESTIKRAFLKVTWLFSKK